MTKMNKAWRPSAIALVAVAMGVLLHAAGFLAFSINLGSPPKPPASKPFLMFLEPGQFLDPVLLEQALLQDSAPLFLPTYWNVAANMEEGQEPFVSPDLFSFFPEEITLSDATFTAVTDGVAPIRRSPSIMGVGDSNPFRLLGREEASFKVSLSQRNGWWELRSLSSGQLIREGELPLLAELSNLALWEPAEFLLSVTREGPVGLPLVYKSTGNVPADNSIRQTLLQIDFRLLEPGYYSVTVGP